MTTLRRQEERVLSSEPSDVIRAGTYFRCNNGDVAICPFPFRLCFDLHASTQFLSRAVKIERRCQFGFHTSVSIKACWG